MVYYLVKWGIGRTYKASKTLQKYNKKMYVH